MARQPCDLAQLTIEAVHDSCATRHGQTHRPGLRRRRARRPGVPLAGNPTLLKEMVRNLVDNAINYTPSTPTSPA
jgi:two-component system sensor histidine kinase TctE